MKPWQASVIQPSRLLSVLALGWCLTAAGCAIYNPVKVWRWSFDYNTERQLAFQAAGYDHLPPRVVRMRLTQWAYNVGPSPVPGGMVIPEGTPVAPQLDSGEPPLPPAPSPDLLESARPPEPAAPLPGPSAGRVRGTAISYQSPAAQSGKSQAAWMFAPR